MHCMTAKAANSESKEIREINTSATEKQGKSVIMHYKMLISHIESKLLVNHRQDIIDCSCEWLDYINF